MNTAEYRLDAKMLFHEGDSAIQIAAAEQDVVQFFRYGLGYVAACQHRCHHRACSHTQK